MNESSPSPEIGLIKYRKLLIAFSAVCGLICLLLIGLWVRSYWRFDQFIRRVSTTNYVAFTSFQGQFAFGMSNDPLLRAVFKQTWARRGFRTSEWDEALRGPVAFFPSTPSPNDTRIITWPWYDKHPFVVAPGTTYTEVILPYWLLFLLVITLGAVLWFKWPKRFSLRTLLIAMTLVAVLLGAVLWAVK
ncbi:MAG: hypothetical protein WD738_05155 [Pirellulales bacterium]